MNFISLKLLPKKKKKKNLSSHFFGQGRFPESLLDLSAGISS